MSARTAIEQARAVAGAFEIDGELVAIERFDRGHIHDTFVSTWKSADSQRRFLHQRINDRVFADIPALMHNVERVTRHLAQRADAECGSLQSLLLVRTRIGRSFLTDASGPWRTYSFVEDSESFDRCDTPERAFEAARAFGMFQTDLADLPAAELRETIPHYFSPRHRLRQLEDAISADPLGRAADAQAEIRTALDRRSLGAEIETRIDSGTLPLRIAHGDTKLNNVLFDTHTRAPKCIVDLDTCMPAWSLYDFGDLVRFTAASSAEDERDLALVGTDTDMYRALSEGYLASAGSFLSAVERRLMPLAAQLVTWMIGVRFLADHLSGDVYFGARRENQNLDRARVQFGMLLDMERRHEELTTV